MRKQPLHPKTSKRLLMKTVCQILIKITSAAIVAVLVGCASPAEQQAHVRSMGDQELCMTWMTKPAINQYQNARLGEIKRRGLNCWQYGNVTAEQRKAEHNLSENFRCLAGCSPQIVTTQPPIQNNIYVPTGPGRIIPGPTPYGK